MDESITIMIDIGFAVKSWASNIQHGVAYSAHFEVYEIIGTDADNKPYFMDKDGKTETEVLNNSQVYMSGSIKWDGCSNWNIEACEKVMLHFCGRRGIKRISEVMVRCWDIAKNTIPGFEGKSNV